MKKNTISLITAFVLFFVMSTLTGQQSKEIKFFNYTYFAYLHGFGYVVNSTSQHDNEADNWAGSTINGIKYHRSVFGAGIGYEQ